MQKLLFRIKNIATFAARFISILIKQMKTLFPILCFLLSVFSAVFPLTAQTVDPDSLFYVQSSAATEWAGYNNVYTYDNLQKAIDDAATWSSDNNNLQAYVLVAIGLYTAPATSFSLKNHVKIVGGFDGDETDINPTHSQDGTTSYATNTVFSGNSVRCVFNDTNLDATATLENAVIANGYSDGYGGGMLNRDNCSPTLNNCTFKNSTANDGGGLCNLNGSSPTLVKCTFTENTATLYGGGVSNETGSNPMFDNCIFSGNKADNGGAIDNYISSSPSFANCFFTENSAAGGGAVINEEDCSPTFANCTFTGNIATGAGGSGMYNLNNGNPTLINCIMALNVNSSNATSNDPDDNVLNDSSFPEFRSSVIGTTSYNNAGTPALNAVTPSLSDFNADGSLTSSAIWAIKKGDYNLYATAMAPMLAVYNALFGTSLTATDMIDINNYFVVGGAPGRESIDLGAFRYFDSTPPIVMAFTPSGAGAMLSGNIVITFSESIAVDGTVSLNSGSPLTGGSWNSSYTVYTLPYSGLIHSALYTAQISGFKSMDAVAMVLDDSRTFTTIDVVTPSMKLSATGGTYSTNEVTLTATVSNVEAGIVPAGSVTFKESDNTLATVLLDDLGTATYIVPSLINPGNYTYTAEYSGDENYNANSATTTIDVTPYLSVSPNTLNFAAYGETKTFTVACNTNWTLGNTASWLTISQGNDEHTMLITAAANPTADQRFALLAFSIANIMSRSIEATQDAADKTAIEAVGAPTIIIYSQNGDVIVKSDVPVKSVAVYDVAGKAVKAINGIDGFNGSITISGLPKNQVLIVKATMNDNSIMTYETTIEIVN